jgi:hypothetical protein
VCKELEYLIDLKKGNLFTKIEKLGVPSSISNEKYDSKRAVVFRLNQKRWQVYSI